MSAPPPFETEPTPIGEQTLVPGVAPIRAMDRMSLRAAAPLAPTRPQKPCDHGLFDFAARAQLSLFDPLPPPPCEDG